MISYLRGTVVSKDLDSIVIDVGGVGYKVSVSSDLAQRPEINSELTIWTYLAVRENAQDLYGFESEDDLTMFELLLTVSGIGPKSAMAIMSTAPSETIIDGIQSADPNYLSKMTGIGQKTAEKVIVGLKDKVGASEINADGTQNQNAVVIDALHSLGYSKREARKALSKIESKDNPSDMIKEALKVLGNAG